MRRTYLRRYFSRLKEDAEPWARDNIGWALVMLITPPIAVLIREPAHEIDWTLVRTTLWIYAIAFGVYLLIHAIRTVWKLDRELIADLTASESREESLGAKLREIEDARPHIIVRNVYTEKVSVNHNGLQACIANVLRVRLENSPPHPYPNSEAKNVTASVNFYDHLGKLLIADMDARWTASTQPVGPHTQSIVPLLGMDLGIGAKRDLDIAFAVMTLYRAPNPSLVALNNDNFRFTCWTKPDRVLEGERFVAEVHVMGPWVDTKFSVEFWSLPYGEIEFRLR